MDNAAWSSGAAQCTYLCVLRLPRDSTSVQSEFYNFIKLFRLLETRDISEVETALANLVGRIVETPSDGGWFWGRNPIVQSKARAQLTKFEAPRLRSDVSNFRSRILHLTTLLNSFRELIDYKAFRKFISVRTQQSDR